MGRDAVKDSRVAYDARKPHLLVLRLPSLSSPFLVLLASADTHRRISRGCQLVLQRERPTVQDREMADQVLKWIIMVVVGRQ